MGGGGEGFEGRVGGEERKFTAELKSQTWGVG